MGFWTVSRLGGHALPRGSGLCLAIRPWELVKAARDASVFAGSIHRRLSQSNSCKRCKESNTAAESLQGLCPHRAVCLSPLNPRAASHGPRCQGDFI